MKKKQPTRVRAPEKIKIVTAEASLARARELVGAVQPVIDPIRQICFTTIGNPDRINKLLEGAIVPLRRIVLACGQDSMLGESMASTGAPSSAREVVENLPSDVIAAALVVHSVGRRLRRRLLKGVAAAFLEEALTRAAMGFVIGRVLEGFGAGRAMLAGFSSRAGLAMIVAEGSDAQATTLLERLQGAESLQDACLKIYQVDPIQVGALVLLAAGCGTGACMGILGCSVSEAAPPAGEDELLWWAVHLLIDQMATKDFEQIPEIVWETLGFKTPSERQDVYDLMQSVSTRGNGWSWLV